MPDFVAGPVARRKKRKTKYLVMWKARIFEDGTVSSDRILTFPGGMEHPAEHGDLEATYAEELEEETGLKLRKGAKITLIPVTIKRPEHTKNFVRVWRRDCTGTLRKVSIDDGTSRLYAPFYADKQYLEQHLHGDHREV